METNNELIQSLEKDIKYYAEQYYSGTPKITDEQFDVLVDKLKTLNPNSSVLKTGWGFEVNGDKIKHKYSHIGSLQKTKTYEDIPELYKGKKVFISPKLDGLSAVLYYEKGVLVKALTRGNGEYGKDITNKMRIIEGSEIKDKTFTGAVRGEIIIHENNWAILQNKYKDLIAPRNFAAGIINRKELDNDIQYLDIIVYKIVGQELDNTQLPFTEREPVLEWLSNNFKHTIPIYYFPTMDKISWDTYHQEAFNDFKKLGYGLDGLVLTMPTVYYNTQTKGYTYEEVAFKFKAETSTTIVKYIEWELSRTNRLIPVAAVEPVELSGAVIQRATCNNAKWVVDMELGEGAEVEITRSNEVIPQILTVLQTGDKTLPTYCPKCDEPLVWDGVDLKCSNDKCPNITESDLQQWCECIGETDGLQWTTMKCYLDMDGIKTIEDIYTNKFYLSTKYNQSGLSITDNKMGECYKKMLEGNIDIVVALVGLNIPRLGDKTAKVLGSQQELIECMLSYYTYLNYNPQEYYNPKMEQTIKERLLQLVKEATTTSILNNIPRFLNLKYLYGNDMSETRIIYNTQNKNNIQYIAVTGSLQTMKRKDFETYINKYNYELTTNLKKCKYLVNNDITSTSTKNKQAKEYGIPIITETEFLNILNIYIEPY